MESATHGHAEQREHPLLVVIEDVEGDTGPCLHGMDDRRAVLRPAQRLRADERHVRGTEMPGRVDVGREDLHQASAGGRPEVPVRRHAVAQAEEHRLVEERLDEVVVDRGHEEVDAGRADVDRGADHGARGHDDGGRPGDRLDVDGGGRAENGVGGGFDEVLGSARGRSSLARARPRARRPRARAPVPARRPRARARVPARLGLGCGLGLRFGSAAAGSGSGCSSGSGSARQRARARGSGSGSAAAGSGSGSGSGSAAAASGSGSGSGSAAAGSGSGSGSGSGRGSGSGSGGPARARARHGRVDNARVPAATAGSGSTTTAHLGCGTARYLLGDGARHLRFDDDRRSLALEPRAAVTRCTIREAAGSVAWRTSPATSWSTPPAAIAALPARPAISRARFWLPGLRFPAPASSGRHRARRRAHHGALTAARRRHRRRSGHRRAPSRAASFAALRSIFAILLIAFSSALRSDSPRPSVPSPPCAPPSRRPSGLPCLAPALAACRPALFLRGGLPCRALFLLGGLPDLRRLALRLRAGPPGLRRARSSLPGGLPGGPRLNGISRGSAADGRAALGAGRLCGVRPVLAGVAHRPLLAPPPGGSCRCRVVAASLPQMASTRGSGARSARWPRSPTEWPMAVHGSLTWAERVGKSPGSRLHPW